MAGSSDQWIAVDWGTSRVRAWLMEGGTVLGERSSDQGMGRLSPGEYEGALGVLAGDWLDGPERMILCCGMVGAKQGWREAAYVPVPSKLEALPLERVTGLRDGRLNVWIVPGLKQPKPADVMRGEETQIAGFLAREPHFDGVLCLPGTHTKWVQISAGEVISFRTFMTGEMFDLLAKQSVLAPFLAGDDLEEAAFLEAVDDAMARPEALGERLFRIRAEATLDGAVNPVSRGRLSGLLIGSELAAARPYWLGQRVIVAADDALAQPYGAALGAQGLEPEVVPVAPLTQAGLALIKERHGALLTA